MGSPHGPRWKRYHQNEHDMHPPDMDSVAVALPDYAILLVSLFLSICPYHDRDEVRQASFLRFTWTCRVTYITNFLVTEASIHYFKRFLTRPCMQGICI